MPTTDTLILITREGMGHGNPELQKDLIKKYLRLVHENDTAPGAIGFYTEGVRLVCEGSPVLTELEMLERAGTHLIICPTCIKYYGLEDRVRVGIVGGMGTSSPPTRTWRRS